MKLNDKIYDKYSSTLVRILRESNKQTSDVDYIEFYTLLNLPNIYDVEIIKYVYDLIILNRIPKHKVIDAFKKIHKYKLQQYIDVDMISRIIYPDKSYTKLSIYEYLLWVCDGDMEMYEVASTQYVQLDMYNVSDVMSKLDCDKDTAIEYITNLKKTTSGTLSNYIKRHGDERGKIKWDEFREKSKVTLSNYIKRHGDERGKIKWDETVSKKSYSASNVGKIEKYGYKNFIRMRAQKSYSCSYLGMVGKFGERKANEIIKNRYNKNDLIGMASMESLLIFIPLYKLLRKHGIQRSDIYLGVGRASEYNIGGYFYDFTILSLNVIIEYNGIRWHPKSPNDVWSNPYSNISCRDKWEYDRKKIKNAESNGFRVIEIWSDDVPNVNDIMRELI